MIDVADVDECKLIPSLCYNGVCIDLKPGFRCECPSGFEYDSVSKICAGWFIAFNHELLVHIIKCYIG